MSKTKINEKLKNLSTRLTSAEQMSDAYLTALLLTFSGGFQDAYTYCFRGKVFANAQTGNIVLLGANLFYGQWARVMHYFIPIFTFVLGACTAEWIRVRYPKAGRLHWRQTVLLLEILTLIAVAFLSEDDAANAVISFVSAAQVQAFREMHGKNYASTMCTGNLRSGTELLCGYLNTHDKALLRHAVRYGGVLLTFVLGAGLGSMATVRFAGKAIWFSAAILTVGFALLFLPPKAKDARTALSKS